MPRARLTWNRPRRRRRRSSRRTTNASASPAATALAAPHDRGVGRAAHGHAPARRPWRSRPGRRRPSTPSGDVAQLGGRAEQQDARRRAAAAIAAPAATSAGPRSAPFASTATVTGSVTATVVLVVVVVVVVRVGRDDLATRVVAALGAHPMREPRAVALRALVVPRRARSCAARGACACASEPASASGRPWERGRVPKRRSGPWRRGTNGGHEGGVPAGGQRPRLLRWRQLWRPPGASASATHSRLPAVAALAPRRGSSWAQPAAGRRVLEVVVAPEHGPVHHDRRARRSTPSAIASSVCSCRRVLDAVVVEAARDLVRVQAGDPRAARQDVRPPRRAGALLEVLPVQGAARARAGCRARRRTPAPAGAPGVRCRPARSSGQRTGGRPRSAARRSISADVRRRPGPATTAPAERAGRSRRRSDATSPPAAGRRRGSPPGRRKGELVS